MWHAHVRTGAAVATVAAVEIDDGEDMIGIYVKHNDVDAALRILKKKVQKAGLLRELRRRRHYEKPSERRRRQKREGIKNARKRQLALR
jgi:small subunit ribosomal protein S21